MSIASALQSAQQKVAAAYTACNNKGATMPAAGSQNLSNLPATINSISTGTPLNQTIQKWVRIEETTTSVDPDTQEEITTTTISYERGADVQTSSTIAASKYANNTGLVSALIPDTVTAIGNAAFSGCTNLEYINLENIKQLNYQAFRNASNLKIKLNMPKLTRFVNGGAQFMGSGITEIESLGTITALIDGDNNGGVFYNCKKLVTAVLPNTLTAIATAAFTGCSALKSVVAENVTTIKRRAFYGCSSFSDDSLFEKCRTIQGQAFQGCTSLPSEISIPNLTSIDTAAFYNTRITKVLDLGTITTLPDCGSYTSATFGENSSLTEVHLPSTITKIGKFTFGNNSHLTTVVCLATTPPSLHSSAFRNYVSNVHFYVPYSADHSILSAYQAATTWSSYSARIHELNEDGTIPA